MKKFIATLLSALVGVFGYTLTDAAVEERISKLETEIVELRKEVSANNQLNGNVGSLEIGDNVKINSTSLDKMLLRENENGKIEFIHPSKIDQVKEDDVFVYITDVTCQVVDFETITFNVEKGKNYEPDTITTETPVLYVKCSGYTSSSLSGKQLTFFTGLGQNISLAPVYTFESSKSTCLISSDGSFNLGAEFSTKEILFSQLGDLNTVYYSLGKEYTETLLLSEYLNQCFFGFSIYNVTIS